MNKADCVQRAYDLLTALLSPACIEHGLSFKTMPSDTDAGVIRTAMLIAFVQGFDTASSTAPDSMATRQVGTVKMQAYVIVLAASQVGPRSATWAAEIATEALQNRTVDGVRVLADSLQFTSFKDGVWQYRLPVSIVMPYCSDNAEAIADTDPVQGLDKRTDW